MSDDPVPPGISPMTTKILLPAEAARKLGIPTLEIIRAMYEKRIPRVRLDDGTLGIPEDALEAFAATLPQ